jgi:hypothetical protein
LTSFRHQAEKPELNRMVMRFQCGQDKKNGIVICDDWRAQLLAELS